MRGTITKKGNKYYGVFDIGRDKNGKRQQKWTRGFDLKREAQKALTESINKINLGVYVNPSKSTVAEYLIEWYQTYVIPNLAYNTSVGYRVNVYNHIIPAIGYMKLKDLQPIHIQKLYNSKSKEGLSPTTVISIHRTMHKALSMAYKMQIIPRNPSEFVELPKKKKYHAGFLNEKEVKQLLYIFKDTELYLPVLLGVGLGLRRGEALGLRWQDIDIENKIINIHHSLTQKTGGNILKETKNESSRRSIMMPEIIIQAILDEKDKQEENRKILGLAYGQTNFVCCRNDGIVISPSALSKGFQKVLKDNSFKKIRFHDLRHTNATLMLKNKIPAKIASDRLGHSNINTTLDLYSHVINDMQKEASNVFDEIMY